MARGKAVAIAIAVIGVGTALLGLYVLRTERPEAGDVVLRVPAPPSGELVIRAERGGDRNFVEYNDADHRWQALIPPYAGRDGTSALAFNQDAIMVRVLRAGDEQIFSFARTHDARLGTITLGPSTAALRTAVRRMNGRAWVYGDNAYQLVPDGADGVAIGMFDLRSGKAVWKTTVPPQDLATLAPPSASAAGLAWRGDAHSYALDAASGVLRQVAPL